MHKVTNRKKCCPETFCVTHHEPAHSSALPTIMEYKCSCKRKRRELTYTSGQQSPILTTHTTILSKLLAIWVSPWNTWQISQTVSYKPIYQYNWSWKGSFSNSPEKVPLTAEMHENVPLRNLGVVQSSHKHQTWLFFRHILCGAGRGVGGGRWNHWVRAVPLPGELGKYFPSKITMSFIYLFNKLSPKVNYVQKVVCK